MKNWDPYNQVWRIFEQGEAYVLWLYAKITVKFQVFFCHVYSTS